MERKWFQSIDCDGSEQGSVASVSLIIHDIDAFRDAVKAKYRDSLLAGIIAPCDLPVFASKMTFDAKGEPYSDSVKKTLIVLLPQRQTGLIACLQDAFADLTSGKRARLIQSLRLSVDVIDPRALRVIDSEALPAFQWGPELSDDKQVEHYTKYLETHLKAMLEEQSLCLMYAGAKSNLLNLVDARLPFDLSDTADLLIVRDLGRRTEENQHHLPGVRLVIELKKNMDNQYEEKEAQATGKLIAVNSKVPALCC